MFRRILTKFIGGSNISKSVKSNDVESIIDLSNDELYDTLSIDCADDIDNGMFGFCRIQSTEGHQ